MMPIKKEGVIWTNEQLEAIYEEDKNIIVSAGAGSGKTAVLSERVATKLKQGIHINELVILTFTNLAAFEMKERIIKKIKKIPDLKNELLLINDASITTFDSYALSLIKKYHYLLNLNKNISIIDPIILSIKKKNLLDEIFEEKYLDNEFKEFIDTFTTKDDNNIKDVIEQFNNKVNTISNKEEYLNTYLDTHYSNDFINNQFTKYENLIIKNRDTIFLLLNSIKEKILDEKLYEFISNIEDELSIIRDKNKYDDFLVIKNFKLPSLPRKIDEVEYIKKYYEKLKDYLNTLKELVEQTEDEIKKEILETKKYIKVIISLLKEYDGRILKFKLEENAFEFNDIMRFCIKLLEENPSVLKEIKLKIKEIMVDEYQDTNDIGEDLLNLLANHNLYKVGDIKQSIYKFRNANPDIFSKTYDNYKNNLLDRAIDLNKNFRSRSEVLSSINLIFKHVMDEGIGGVNYDQTQELFFGNKAYLDNNQNNYLEIKNYSVDNKYKKDEIEAFIVADDILKKINDNYLVYDFDLKQNRKVNYKDFVILIDRKSSFDLYRKIFEYKGIPLVVHKDSTFSYNKEIYVIKNLIELICCFKNNDFVHLKYSFISILRSYLFEYSDDIIYKNINNILECDDYKEIVNKLRDISNYAFNHSLSQILNKIYKDFNLYYNSIKIGNIEEVNTKLDYLLDITKNLEKIGYTLNDFKDYLNNMYDMKLDISFSNKEEDKDAVHIMTIHASKGLEFPICYFPSLYKKFNIDDVKASFLFDNNIGLITPIFKEGIKDTIYKTLAKEEYIKKDISERIRLFYVALTRAKEKIIMISNINEIEESSLSFENGLVNALERLKYKSFLDILVSIKSILKPYIINTNYTVDEDYELIKKIDYEKYLEKNDIKFIYKQIDIAKKEINTKYSNQYSNALDIKKMDLGTNLHEVLEYIDFNKKNVDDYEIDAFLKKKILKLFDMPFMKDINSSKIYKEFEFIYEGKSGIIDLLIENEKMIIVDYKMKDINKESYTNQVRNYISYIKTITNKEVIGYIYSIINEEYIEIL